MEKTDKSVYGLCMHGDNLANCDVCNGYTPVYFVERKDNGLWISEKENHGDNHTFNPCHAKQFKTIQAADKYIADNDLKEWYHSTEHNFFSTLP